MPSDTELPIVIFDTSALKALGESIQNQKLHRLLYCSTNGHIDLYIPYKVIQERASQIVEKQRRIISRSDNFTDEEKQEKLRDLYSDLPKEIKRLRLLLEKNGATILNTEPRHRRKAQVIIEGNAYECSEKKDKDERDAIITEVAVGLATKKQSGNFIFAVNDRGPKGLVNDYQYEEGQTASISLYGSNEILDRLLVSLPEDGSKNVSSVSDDELSPLDIQTVVDTAQERPPSLANFNMEEAQREMAERFKFSQQCLIAASHLMFPATDKEGVVEKLKLAWDIDPSETEGAASYLMNEGYLEDLYGDYSVTNEDFAEQAIYALGNDINNLIEVLD